MMLGNQYTGTAPDLLDWQRYTTDHKENPHECPWAAVMMCGAPGFRSVVSVAAATVLWVLANASAAAQQPMRDTGAVSGGIIVGAGLSGGAIASDLSGPQVGGRISVRAMRNIEWTALRAVFTFPSAGGYATISTSAITRDPAGRFVGGGVGITRFDFDQSVVFVRAGTHTSIARIPFDVELNLEYHSRWEGSGRRLSLLLDVPTWRR